MKEEITSFRTNGFRGKKLGPKYWVVAKGERTQYIGGLSRENVIKLIKQITPDKEDEFFEKR